MKYRKFGHLDFKVSALGFGAMRLPCLNKDMAKIDTVEATAMLHYAIDQGVNYVDTAYVYHAGNSELFLGQALKHGYRNKVKLVTKLPSWKVESARDFDKFFNEQLEKLQTDRVDFYLLHALNKDLWPKLRDLDVLSWAERAIAAGRIGCLGFSFHDSFDVFKEIVDAYDKWTISQIQYNYMDVENQAGIKGLQYAASKGLAVAIMEPILGGRLVNPPQPIQAIWDTAVHKRNPADWALQWVWNQPEPAVVLSGMSTLAQIKENVANADRSGINTLTAAELALFDQVRRKYHELTAIPCTQCNYCMPCSNHVDIPLNFDIYNSGLMYDKPDNARGQYGWIAERQRLGMADANQQAGECRECGECESKCPQAIPIMKWLSVAHKVLGEKQPYAAKLE
jgi:hypothetical protein